MRRRLIIILIAVLIISAIAIVAAFVINRSPDLQNKLGITNQPSAENTNLAVTNTVKNTNTPANADRANITYVARNFAEVYGSGTNQNDSANIVQSKQWATSDFQKFLDRQIAQERANPTTPFHSFTSTALVINVTRQTTTVAAVTVGLQRKETIDATSKNLTQELYLDLLKQGTDWKINAARWQAL